MQIDTAKLEDAIVRQAVDELVNADRLDGIIRTEVDKRINAIFTERATALIEARVDAAVKEGFEHEYRRTDNWGNPCGPPTTIKKELDRIVGGYWGERVCKRAGTPKEGNYDTVSRAQYLMTQICAQDFTETLKQSALNVTGALKDGLRGQIAKHMDGMLDELFRVKSLQDQGKVEKPY